MVGDRDAAVALRSVAVSGAVPGASPLVPKLRLGTHLGGQLHCPRRGCLRVRSRTRTSPQSTPSMRSKASLQSAFPSGTWERGGTPELARIGFQPRRDPGDAQPQPLPGASGAATWNAAARELSVPALPPNATSLRAFRKPAGGEPEPAGVSTTTTVSVTAFAPLTPGVSYEVWIAGHNSRGDGPESNRVTFTA